MEISIWYDRLTSLYTWSCSLYLYILTLVISCQNFYDFIHGNSDTLWHHFIHVNFHFTCKFRLCTYKIPALNVFWLYPWLNAYEIRGWRECVHIHVLFLHRDNGIYMQKRSKLLRSLLTHSRQPRISKMCTHTRNFTYSDFTHMGWLRLVGSLKL